MADCGCSKPIQLPVKTCCGHKEPEPVVKSCTCSHDVDLSACAIKQYKNVVLPLYLTDNVESNDRHLVKWLVDTNGEDFFPVAHAGSVITDEGITLTQKLNELDNKLKKINIFDYAYTDCNGITQHIKILNNENPDVADYFMEGNTTSALSSNAGYLLTQCILKIKEALENKGIKINFDDIFSEPKEIDSNASVNIILPAESKEEQNTTE